MRSLKCAICLILALLFAALAFAQEARPWYQDAPWQPPRVNPKLKVLPLIRVQGNHFVDPQGQTVLFRGMAISDPDKIERQGHWNKAHFEKVKAMGPNLVRIPVHPIAWRERTPEKYLQLLDEAVEWCTDLGMYVMIDWHSIGNLQTEVFQNPMYITTKAESYEFWRTISRHFAGNNTVAFYELFNEPTTYRGQLGPCSWADWKKLNETMITIIRAHDRETIPLVAGFDWAYDLTPLREEPIAAENIGYTTHPYPFKRSEPWPPKWEEDFGFAAGQYPVVATEFGYFENPTLKGDNPGHYGSEIISFLEGKGCSWVVWVFDPEWGPSLLKNWNYDLSNGGEFFQKALKGQLEVQARKP
ncbi:MAG TPA: glycoside hydrolase family 5 protein [bacterium]|nr:glycoside hydrolase family 5 protein [bacterium]HPR87730.1 glycoside hydrolase family 5 protein [bacterium]